MTLETISETPSSTTSLDPEKLTDWCLKAYKRCKDNRTTVEKQWYINMAFYAGKQNVRLMNSAASASGFQLVIPPAPPYRVRLVINRIRPMVRSTVAKITSQKPRFTVVPATSEDNDQASARVAEQVFDSIYSTKNIKRVLRRAEWWTVVCGTSFVKTYWDPTAIDKQSNQQGDIVPEHVTPFHVYVPDLREEELENQPFLIHASMKSLEWAKQAYPNVEIQSTKAANDILEDSFLNMTGIQTAGYEQVLMLEFWIKPGHPMFPKGGLVTMLGEQIVQVVSQYPYNHGEFPFCKLDAIPSGKFYAESPITDLVPVQREYNRRRSQIIEAANLMGKPKLLYAKGSLDINKVTSEPGQGIPYLPGFPAPQQMNLAPLPGHVMQEVQQLQQDMDDLSGQTEISRGSNPSQVTAATALSYLQEQNDTKLADTISSLEEGVEKMGRLILSYVSQYWTTGRVVRIVGADGAFDAQVYKGADLGGNLDVRVEAGSALPQSKAAKQAFVMDLMKLFPQYAEKGFELLEIGGIEKIYDDFLTDKRQAQRENMKMAEGVDIQPNDFDNHAVHIEIHNKFRKSQEFESLPDEVKQVFQLHIDMHYVATGQKPAVGLPLMPMGGPMDPAMEGLPGGPVGMPGVPPQDQAQLPPGAPAPPM